MGICYCVKLDRHLEMKAACNAELTKEERASMFLLSLNFPFSGVTNSSLVQPCALLTGQAEPTAVLLSVQGQLAPGMLPFSPLQ